MQIFFGALGTAAVVYAPAFFAKHSVHEFKFTLIGIGSAATFGFCAATIFGASFARGQKHSIFRDKEFYNLWFIFSSLFCIVTIPVGLLLDGAVQMTH